MPSYQANRTSAVKAAATLLGVKTGATTSDVMRARRELAKQWHPDVSVAAGSAERMGRINQACDLLCDFIRRGGRVVVGATTARRAKRTQVSPEGRVYDAV